MNHTTNPQAACRSTQHCAYHGWCRRCDPAFAETMSQINVAIQRTDGDESHWGPLYEAVAKALRAAVSPSVVVSADRATLLAEVATALIGRHCSPESIAVVRRLVDECLCTTCQAYGQTVEDTTDGGIVWRCKDCNGEGMRRAAAEEQPTETQDSLPAWLYQRFMPDGVGWENLDADDRSYWEHQARAVRRAVARGGFKAEYTSPAVAEQPNNAEAQAACGRPASIEGPCSAGDWCCTEPAVAEQPDTQTREAGRTVAYVLTARTELHCLRCTPNPAGDIWTPVSAEELDDGGICTACGRDVLIPAEPAP